MIQNTAAKWKYFSGNGDNVYSSGTHTGGREFDDIAVGEFDNPQQFLNSDYNSNRNKDNKSINSYEYSEGYVIPTSAEQDEIIKDKFINISGNEEYSLNVNEPNHCATGECNLKCVSKE